MITFNNYLMSAIPKKLNDQERKKLMELDYEYGEAIYMFRHDRNYNNLVNLDAEREKFLEARKIGKLYIPQFTMEPNKFSTNGLLEKMNHLKREFENFPCFLSKYYIHTLEYFINKVEFTIKKNDNIPNVTYIDTPPSEELYNKALEVVKKYPYKVIPKGDRNLTAKDAKQTLQKALDKLGYPWKVYIKPDMMARVGVDEDGTVVVKKSGEFSEQDFDGLIAHELKGHVGRRYYGMQTGLHLFWFGLYNRNYLDEGLAVWNSLNIVKEIKPNVLFNIALKLIIVYQMNHMYFNEIFDLCKELCPTIPDKILFNAIARSKRDIQDMSLLGGWNDTASYFTGYTLVNEMTDKERDDVLKYNVGPDDWNDLPKIKEFFKLNKFEPLKFEDIDFVKDPPKNYE